MHVVAILELATSIEAAAAALAAELGTLAYEERLKLAAGLPAVVLLAPDPLRATALAEGLAARGQPAVAFAGDEVVMASDMVSLRRFAFTEDALVAGEGAGARLPWADLALLIRANDRRRVETERVVKEKKFDLTRTVVSGGLIRSRTTTQTVTTRADDSEPVLYLFRTSGATPFILREQGTHYEALGARLESTAAPNFLATVAELRARAPEAGYDERLLSRRRPPVAAGAAGGKLSSPHDLDLLAHLVARALTHAGR
jgi:hypothetical protein